MSNWRHISNEWVLAPDSRRFLYNKFIGVDACFRLKRRHVPSEESDPGLWTGLAYYVPQPQYQKFVKQLTEQKEVSGNKLLG
ncbi:hypothetical protein MPER_05808 [Moniliophthora perniciosa FA553]|nr:hypothetical protein MPER_05808 [Moniliophthora perniciosa FA553]